jgi:phosphoglucomutase
MTLDWDGKIRMDCSSPYAMASLIGPPRTGLGSPPATTRTPTGTGSSPRTPACLNPNHYLAVAIAYLFAPRDGWPAGAAVGKTIVVLPHESTGSPPIWAGGCWRCPVGFKWFVPGLADAIGRLRRQRRAPARRSCAATGRCGPPTRTASCSRLLAAEITAVTGRTPVRALRGTWRPGSATRRTRGWTARAPGSRRPRWAALSPGPGVGDLLAGDPITGSSRRHRATGRASAAWWCDRAGVVRGPAVRHRGRLQGLRRVLPRTRAPDPGAGGGPGGGVRRPEV